MGILTVGTLGTHIAMQNHGTGQTSKLQGSFWTGLKEGFKGATWGNQPQLEHGGKMGIIQAKGNAGFWTGLLSEFSSAGPTIHAKGKVKDKGKNGQ